MVVDLMPLVGKIGADMDGVVFKQVVRGTVDRIGYDSQAHFLQVGTVDQNRCIADAVHLADPIAGLGADHFNRAVLTVLEHCDQVVAFLILANHGFIAVGIHQRNGGHTAAEYVDGSFGGKKRYGEGKLTRQVQFLGPVIGNRIGELPQIVEDPLECDEHVSRGGAVFSAHASVAAGSTGFVQQFFGGFHLLGTGCEIVQLDAVNWPAVIPCLLANSSMVIIVSLGIGNAVRNQNDTGVIISRAVFLQHIHCGGQCRNHGGIQAAVVGLGAVSTLIAVIHSFHNGLFIGFPILAGA